MPYHTIREEEKSAPTCAIGDNARYHTMPYHTIREEEKSSPACAIGDNAMSEIAPLSPPHCQPDDLAKPIY